VGCDFSSGLGVSVLEGVGASGSKKLIFLGNTGALEVVNTGAGRLGVNLN